MEWGGGRKEKKGEEAEGRKYEEEMGKGRGGRW